MQTGPTHCIFDHPVLNALNGAVFRLTEGDRVAALAIHLDSSEAIVPLRAVPSLFSIPADSADGRLLHLIGRALQFVPALRPGDPLPAEVLTGEASWQPSPYHRQVASARLQLQLLNWIGRAGPEQAITSQMLVVSIDDPSIRPRVQEALRHAAAELGVSGGGPAVAALIEELAVELAYIEALRERLLVRVHGLLRGLGRLGHDAGALAANRRETLFQVTRLATLGHAQVAAKFDHVDAETREILAALRNLERQRTFLRPNRDWLYTAQVAWDPILRQWEDLPPTAADERLWRVLDQLYRFLAPRYMAVQEWRATPQHGGGAERSRGVVW